DGVVTVAQRRKMPSLNRLFKRRLQSFSIGEYVERFDALRFLFEFCFGKTFYFAGEVTKFSHDLRIDLVVAVGIKRLGAVKRNLQPARLIQRLDPNSRCQQLITGGMG